LSFARANASPGSRHGEPCLAWPQFSWTVVATYSTSNEDITNEPGSPLEIFHFRLDVATTPQALARESANSACSKNVWPSTLQLVGTTMPGHRAFPPPSASSGTTRSADTAKAQPGAPSGVRSIGRRLPAQEPLIPWLPRRPTPAALGAKP